MIYPSKWTTALHCALTFIARIQKLEYLLSWPAVHMEKVSSTRNTISRCGNHSLKCIPTSFPVPNIVGLLGKPLIRKYGFLGAMPVYGLILVALAVLLVISIYFRRERLRILPIPSSGPAVRNGRAVKLVLTVFLITQSTNGRLQHCNLNISLR